jgi:hypothetical protein
MADSARVDVMAIVSQKPFAVRVRGEGRRGDGYVPKSEIRNPQSAIRNPQSEIRNPQSKIRNPKSKIQNEI